MLAAYDLLVSFYAAGVKFPIALIGLKQTWRSPSSTLEESKISCSRSIIKFTELTASFAIQDIRPPVRTNTYYPSDDLIDCEHDVRANNRSYHRRAVCLISRQGQGSLESVKQNEDSCGCACDQSFDCGSLAFGCIVFVT